MNDDRSALENFAGKARLFPLPNLVMFPHVMQPLHIFEPRYRQMTADTLANDQLLALVLLKPGWDKESLSPPAIHPIACLTRVVADQVLPDGRYNLLVRGLARVLLHDEIRDDRLYRIAQAELLFDEGIPELDLARKVRQELAQAVLSRFASARARLEEIFASEIPLGALCDFLGFALPLPLDQKQELLGELDVTRRAEGLLIAIDQFLDPGSGQSGARKYPPDFSPN